MKRFLILALLLCAFCPAAFAAEGGLTVDWYTWTSAIPVPMNLPAEYVKYGVWIEISTPDPEIEVFRITMVYVDEQGRTRTMQEFHDRFKWRGKPEFWTNVLLQIGKVRVKSIDVLAVPLPVGEQYTARIEERQ
jgi:hypothetical protein